MKTLSRTHRLPLAPFACLFLFLGFRPASAQIQPAPGVSPTQNPPNSAHPTNPSTKPPFSVISWNGENSFLLGADYPWQNYGTDFGTGGWGKYTDWTTISSDFATLHNEGVHIVRWWVFGDARYDPLFNADGTCAGLDSDVLPNIDQAMESAAANQIYLLLVVLDNPIWDNAQTVDGVTLGGHAAMITDAAVQSSYINNALIPLVQHIAASPYKQTVLGYDIVNEPEGQLAGYWGGDANFATAPVQSFVKACAVAIRKYGAGAYATVGSAKAQWTSLWKGLGLDFYQVHYYSQFDNGGSAGSGLPTCDSLKLDKPCIVGEYSTVDVSYGLADATALSANWYLNTIYNYGYAGAIAWSYQAGDNYSNWSSFQPVFTHWATANVQKVGPK